MDEQLSHDARSHESRGKESRCPARPWNRLTSAATRMPRHDTIVIGASAGGLQALTTLLERLPPSLPAAVLIVVHTPSDGSGELPDILARVSALPVAFAEHGGSL